MEHVPEILYNFTLRGRAEGVASSPTLHSNFAQAGCKEISMETTTVGECLHGDDFFHHDIIQSARGQVVPLWKYLSGE